jgi:DNA-binding transcriptional LysR family regulator
MLSVTRLQVFREVVSHGSFSAAADALDYSQSAVSQAIATLEGEAGVALIERTRAGARPTAAGAALAGHASGVLAQIEAA